MLLDACAASPTATAGCPCASACTAAPVFAGDVGPRVPPHLHGHGRHREPRGAAHGPSAAPGEILATTDVVRPVTDARSSAKRSSRSW